MLGKAKISRVSEFSSLLPGLQWHKWLCSVTSFPHISSHKLLIFPLLIYLSDTVTKYCINRRQILNLDILDIGGPLKSFLWELFCASSRVFSRILRFKEHSLPLSCSCDNLWQIPVSSPSKVVPTWEFQMRGRKEKTRFYIHCYCQRKGFKCWINIDTQSEWFK